MEVPIGWLKICSHRIKFSKRNLDATTISSLLNLSRIKLLYFVDVIIQYPEVNFCMLFLFCMLFECKLTMPGVKSVKFQSRFLCSFFLKIDYSLETKGVIFFIYKYKINIYFFKYLH